MEVRHQEIVREDFSRAGMTRRHVIVGGVLAATGAALVVHSAAWETHARTASAVTTGDAVPSTLVGEGFQVRTEGKDPAVLLCTSSGTPVQRFRGYRFRDVVLLAHFTRLVQADGNDALEMICSDAANGDAEVRALFVPRGRRLEVTYEVVRGEILKPEGGMVLRESYAPEPVPELAHGVFDWTRDSRGGIPFQRDGTFVYTQAHPAGTVALVAQQSNTEWRNNSALHLPVANDPSGALQAKLYAVVSDERNPAMLAGIATARALFVDLTTHYPFNIATDDDSPLQVEAVILNGGDAREVRLEWTCHDFDGAVIGSDIVDVAMASGEITRVGISVDLPVRGIGFVEATVRSGRDECYARTNVARLPAHEFSRGSSHSMFGIAAAYLFDTTEERDLLKRIGARRSRHLYFDHDDLSKFGFRQHRLRTPPSLDAFDHDPKGLTAYVEGELDLAESGAAIAYELGNEMNKWGAGAYTGDGAKKYVHTWARAFRQELRRRESTMKLVSVGLAGMDVEYANALFEAGIGKYADAFNIHPGRGNFTPDFAPDWSLVRDGKNRAWSFFGALKEARGLLDDHAPDMELWLTEVYACTRPNAWWDDSYRHAAENVLLTAALAHAVGVTSMLWFQLYDNTRANPHGARPSDREHHFGLLLRDLSPKPSLLAYAAAAEHLDGARFARWMKFDDESAYGLEFTTPRGRLSIIWSRADGYRLNQEEQRTGSFYPSPEPWEETWKTVTRLRLPASRSQVIQIDTIGRRSTLSAENGFVDIDIDGAPRMFYGLDHTAISSAKSIPGGHRRAS